MQCKKDYKRQKFFFFRNVVLASTSCVYPADVGLKALVWVTYEVVGDLLDQIAGVLKVGLVSRPKCICIRKVSALFKAELLQSLHHLI